MAEKISDEVVNIHLTMPKKMFELLEQERKNFSYLNIQTIILETIRDRYYMKDSCNNKKGSKTPNLTRAASRDNVFVKGGEGKIS